jgi:hypothetical protein
MNLCYTLAHFKVIAMEETFRSSGVIRVGIFRSRPSSRGAAKSSCLQERGSLRLGQVSASDGRPETLSAGGEFGSTLSVSFHGNRLTF